jgi:hypothetical protein
VVVAHSFRARAGLNVGVRAGRGRGTRW